MGGILKNLIGLQDFSDIVLNAVPPVECLVAITCDFEVLVVDPVANGGHISHLHVC